MSDHNYTLEDKMQNREHSQ